MRPEADPLGAGLLDRYERFCQIYRLDCRSTKGYEVFKLYLIHSEKYPEEIVSAAMGKIRRTYKALVR